MSEQSEARGATGDGESVAAQARGDAPAVVPRSLPAAAKVAAGSALAGLVAVGVHGVAFGLGVAVGAQVGLRAGLWMQPRPMPHQMAAWLEHPWRLRYRNPRQLLPGLDLFAGMRVGDLGCGSGLFTVEMARRVGERGKVHAVDCQAPLLARAQRRVEAAGLAGCVRFHHSGIHQLPLADDELDVAVMVAVIGELPAREAALEEVRRVLKPGGRLVVSEELPDPAYAPGPLVRRWATAVGFRPAGTVGTPFCYSAIFLNDKGSGRTVSPATAGG